MIEKYIGLKFVDRGRVIDGLDCWGLVMLLYKDLLLIDLPEFPISATDSNRVATAMSESVDKGEWAKVDGDPQFGDIIAMALCPRMMRAINHVGFCVGDGKFIHAIMDQRSAMCRMDDTYWHKRVKGAYRWQG